MMQPQSQSPCSEFDTFTVVDLVMYVCTLMDYYYCR